MMSCLPFCATEPVSAMEKPTLIGSAARAGAPSASPESATTTIAATICRTFSMGVSSVLRSETLFHHLVARQDTPQIRCRRVLSPGFGTLWMIAVPRPRLEIAEVLVHAVELGEGLGDEPVRRTVVREQVMADAVAAWSPQQLVAVQAEKIAGLLHVRPVAQLEGGVKMPVRAGLHQIDGVMIGAAAQEREEIAHPIGFAKAEHVAIEFGDVLDVGDMERDMAELVRHDAVRLEFLMRKVAALEHFHDRALGILEHQHVGDRRFGILAALGGDPVATQLLFESIEIGGRRNLKADARALRLRALAQHDRMMIDRRGEIDRILLLCRDGETENCRVIFGLLRQIRRFIGSVRDLADADHARSPSDYECFARGSAAMTSTMAATSLSPRPISMQRR